MVEGQSRFTAQSVGTPVPAFGAVVLCCLLFNTGAIYFGFAWDALFSRTPVPDSSNA